MPTQSSDYALLRVLACLAWADGTLTEEEVQFLHGLAAEFRLTAEERAAFEAVLEEPAGLEEFEAAVRAFQSVAKDGEAIQLVERAERLVAADGERESSELRYLGLIRGWLQEAPQSLGAPSAPTAGSEAAAPKEGGGALASFLGGIRNVLSGQGAEKAEGRTAQGLLGKMKKALSGVPGGNAPKISELRAYYATLFGSLLYRVVYADAIVREEEAHHLREVLEGQFGFGPAEVDLVLESIQRRVASDLDRQRLCAEFNRITTMEQRWRLVEALFALAQKDGHIASDEDREIRLISNYLWVEVQEYARIRRTVVSE